MVRMRVYSLIRVYGKVHRHNTALRHPRLRQYTPEDPPFKVRV